MLNRIGINNNRLDTYNALWDITADISRTSGLSSSLRFSLEMRRFLLNRTSRDRITELITGYSLINSPLVDLLLRINNRGNNLPLIRIINYIIFSIIGNKRGKISLMVK